MEDCDSIKDHGTPERLSCSRTEGFERATVSEGVLVHEGSASLVCSLPLDALKQSNDSDAQVQTPPAPLACQTSTNSHNHLGSTSPMNSLMGSFPTSLGGATPTVTASSCHDSPTSNSPDGAMPTISASSCHDMPTSCDPQARIHACVDKTTAIFQQKPEEPEAMDHNHCGNWVDSSNGHIISNSNNDTVRLLCSHKEEGLLSDIPDTGMEILENTKL